MKKKNRNNKGKCKYFIKGGNKLDGIVCPEIRAGNKAHYSGCKVCGYNENFTLSIDKSNK